MKKQKICYSLLNYEAKTHRHYFHIYEFIEALGQVADVRLLVMDAQDPPCFKHPTRTIDLTGRGGLGRLKRCLAILKARLDGYRIFYHHYTMAPARFSALVNRLTGGKTYLWHCIVMEALDDIVNTSGIQRRMLALTFKLVHHLVTGTEFMAEYYANRYPVSREQIKVIPNYINLNRFTPQDVDPGTVRQSLKIDSQKKIILYLHEIEEGRASQLPFIIESLFKKRDDVVFVVAGDGRYRQELESNLTERIESNQVHFVGRVANTETPLYYAAADVYIMTSNFEAFSRVLLEAMAMETPYVATDGGGNIRTYTPPEHQDYILPNNQLTLFAEKIDELLTDSECRNRFITAGKRHVQQFSLEHVIKKFMEMTVGS